MYLHYSTFIYIELTLTKNNFKIIIIIIIFFHNITLFRSKTAFYGIFLVLTLNVRNVL